MSTIIYIFGIGLIMMSLFVDVPHRTCVCTCCMGLAMIMTAIGMNIIDEINNKSR